MKIMLTVAGLAAIVAGFVLAIYSQTTAEVVLGKSWFSFWVFLQTWMPSLLGGIALLGLAYLIDIAESGSKEAAAEGKKGGRETTPWRIATGSIIFIVFAVIVAIAIIAGILSNIL